MNNQFNQTCVDPRVSYFGNVNVGTDVTLAELRQLYHTVRGCKRNPTRVRLQSGGTP